MTVRTQLRAKRRWGELLGPAEAGRPKNVSARNDSPTPTADRAATHRARSLADALRETPERSDRQIAGAVGVSDKTVGKVRAELVANADIPHKPERVEATGRKARGRKPTKPADAPRKSVFDIGDALTRKQAVAELSKEGLSTRKIGEVLGVNNATVARDRRPVANATPADEKPAGDAEPETVPVANATPDPQAEAKTQTRKQRDRQAEAKRQDKARREDGPYAPGWCTLTTRGVLGGDPADVFEIANVTDALGRNCPDSDSSGAGNPAPERVTGRDGKRPRSVPAISSSPASPCGAPSPTAEKAGSGSRAAPRRSGR